MHHTTAQKLGALIHRCQFLVNNIFITAQTAVMANTSDLVMVGFTAHLPHTGPIQRQKSRMGMSPCTGINKLDGMIQGWYNNRRKGLQEFFWHFSVIRFFHMWLISSLRPTWGGSPSAPWSQCLWTVRSSARAEVRTGLRWWRRGAVWSM